MVEIHRSKHLFVGFEHDLTFDYDTRQCQGGTITLTDTAGGGGRAFTFLGMNAGSMNLNLGDDYADQPDLGTKWAPRFVRIVRDGGSPMTRTAAGKL